MKKLLVILLALLACAASLSATGQEEQVFVSIGTGGTAGTYYPLGGAMAELISKAAPYINATAVSTGASVVRSNLRIYMLGAEPTHSVDPSAVIAMVVGSAPTGIASVIEPVVVSSVTSWLP